MSTDDTNTAAASSAEQDAVARTAKPRAPKPRAAGEPTLPRAIDPATGLELDEHGLPLSGPARKKVLEERGITDPALSDNEQAETIDG